VRIYACRDVDRRLSGIFMLGKHDEGEGGGDIPRVYRAPSRMPLTSGTGVRSAKNGIRSVSSASCGSLNHDETGTALFG